MLLFIERELKIAMRNWELVAVNILTSTALALTFSALSYVGGLIASLLISSYLYTHLLLLREEELGTLDGLRLLGRYEEYFGAKIATATTLNLLTSAAYTAAYGALSTGPIDVLAALYTPFYLATASTAAAAIATATRARQALSLFITSALSLGFAASVVRGGLDIPTAMAGPALAAAAILLSKEIS
jgi:hypothetical protein